MASISGQIQLKVLNSVVVCYSAVVLGIIFASAVDTYASPITYTETGTASGTLGGVAFTNATVTLTAFSDTSNIIFIDGSKPIYENLSQTTLSISGLGTATFTGTQIGAFSQDAHYIGAGVGIVGFGDGLTGKIILANYTSIPPFYDLASSTSITGVGGNNVATFGTTNGDLIINSVSGNATFAASIPEPSTAFMGTIGIFVLSAAFLRRRSALAR